jgi:hypothetical protein
MGRIHADAQGGWHVALGQGASCLRQGPFTGRAEAEDWAMRAGLAVKQCTIRIGSKRFLGTAAEALQRWAIDQGTLPRVEGGTQLAPTRRLASLAADPACQWPLSLLQPASLAALRRVRISVLASPAPTLCEQAALAAALKQFRDFHLPGLDDPFGEAAPDGVHVLDDPACRLAQAQAELMGGFWPRLIGLLLSSGASWEELCAGCCGQVDRAAGCLHLAGGRRIAVPGQWLPDASRAADAPLLPGCYDAETLMAGFAAMSRRLNCSSLRPEAFQLTALVAALARGCHLDEMLRMAGGGDGHHV